MRRAGRTLVLMTLAKVLVVSDEPTAAVVRSALSQTFACEVANTGDAGLAAFGRAQFDVVVSDEAVEDVRGLDLLETLRSRSPGVPFILLGGAGDVASATEAGAFPSFVTFSVKAPVERTGVSSIECPPNGRIVSFGRPSFAASLSCRRRRSSSVTSTSST